MTTPATPQPPSAPLEVPETHNFMSPAPEWAVMLDKADPGNGPLRLHVQQIHRESEALQRELNEAKAEVERFTEIVKNVNAHRGRSGHKMIVPKDAEGRAVYWKARANSAEGELAKTLTDILDYESKQPPAPPRDPAPAANTQI